MNALIRGAGSLGCLSLSASSSSSRWARDRPWASARIGPGLPPTNSPPDGEGEATGGPGRVGRRGSGQELPDGEASKLEYVFGPHPPLPFPLQDSLLRSRRFPNPARPARPVVVVECADPLPLCTRSRTRPSSTVNTSQSSGQANHCLFSEALERQTHTTESQAEILPTTATPSTQQTLCPSLHPAPPQATDALDLGDRQGRW